MITGVILAGGAASRMGGGDKCLLPLGGQTLLAGIIARLAPQVDRVVLNANDDPARFAGFGVSVVPDSLPDRPGPLAGVLAGMETAAPGHVVTVAGDTPHFPTDLVAGLRAALGPGHPIALAASPNARRGWGLHPTFGLWPTDLAADLRAALQAGTRKVVIWAERHGFAEARFPASDGDPFFNINTPEDLAAAQARLAP
ncbi:MAG: molybdenum cofactor guanylyltransferase MobA [Pseudomonadota bacterium]